MPKNRPVMDHPAVVSRGQLLVAGITRSALEARLRSGRWQRVLPRVYATHSGQVTLDELLTAALLYAGPDAALSHETAAMLHRMPFAARTVHVTLPNDRRVGAQPGLTIHYSRRWEAADRTMVRGLACTTAARTVLDLVACARTAGDAAAIIVDAVGSRRTTSDRIRALARRTPPFRHGAVLLEVITEAADGAHSPLELRHALVCRQHALPVGNRQRREVLGGRICYMDDLLEPPYDIVTELDGVGGHSSAREQFRDMDRDNANTEQ